MEGKQAARGLMEVLLSRLEGERSISAPSVVSVYGILSAHTSSVNAAGEYSALDPIKERRRGRYALFA